MFVGAIKMSRDKRGMQMNVRGIEKQIQREWETKGVLYRWLTGNTKLRTHSRIGVKIPNHNSKQDLICLRDMLLKNSVIKRQPLIVASIGTQKAITYALCIVPPPTIISMRIHIYYHNIIVTKRTNIFHFSHSLYVSISNALTAKLINNQILRHACVVDKRNFRACAVRLY